MVSVADLRKQFPGAPRPALDGISFSVAAGEFVGILGPSGVGKSTLLRCINHLVTPTAGRVEVDGVTLDPARPRELIRARRAIAMIFQQFNLVGRMSVLMNVLTGRLATIGLARALTFQFPADDRGRAVRALARVGIAPEMLGRRADRLSGGERQRVAIARALVQEPKILLADEPVASLDIALQDVVMDLIQDINRRERITVLMSIHDVVLARRYCGRIIGLAGGQIVHDGGPETLTDAQLRSIYQASRQAESA